MLSRDEAESLLTDIRSLHTYSIDGLVWPDMRSYFNIMVKLSCCCCCCCRRLLWEKEEMDYYCPFQYKKDRVARRSFGFCHVSVVVILIITTTT